MGVHGFMIIYECCRVKRGREREREEREGREREVYIGKEREREEGHSLEIVIIIDGECPRISDGCCHSALHLLLKVTCWFQEEELS